jgi:hypothetical protein
MTHATPKIRNTVVKTSEPIKNKWSLSVTYWKGQEILETFAAGKTREKTLENWFAQYYEGNPPERGACHLPRGNDLIFLSWVEFVKE